jgi:hypothetical protein
MAASAEIVPSSIYADGKEVSFASLHATFSESEYGQTLLESVRWGMFQPGGITNEDWWRPLGPDANNLHHLALSSGLRRVFLRDCRNPPAVWGDRPVSPEATFTRREEEDFGLNVIVHDWPEAIDGDTAQPSKTQNQDELEAQHLLEIVGEIVKGEELQTRIASVIPTILLDKTTKAGKAFHAFEIAGYFRTGMRGWRLSRDFQGEDPYNLRDSYRGMTFSVHTHNVGILLEYARIYPPLFAQVMAYKDQIDEVYAVDAQEAAEVLQRFEPKWKVPELRELFEQNREKWHQWKEEFVTV